MRFRALLSLLLIVAVTLTLAVDSADAGRRVRTFGQNDSQTTDEAKPKAKNGDAKPFAELTKDKVMVEGLFNFYQDTTDNSWLMEIKPDQFGMVYLCGLTRSAAAGAYYDHSSMGRSFPFYLKQVGKQILMLEKNLRFRADSTAALARAIPAAVSDHLVASTKVHSQPHDSTGAILVKADDLFIVDAQNVGYFMGSLGKTGISMDKSNSFFERVKSFPNNSEIDVRLHFKTKKPLSGSTMQNPYSMFHLYHFSLSTLPETEFVPRLADDRTAHFLTIYQDYTNLDTESPYVRFVERWHLEKKDPDAALSEPVEPIVFWVENTTPVEYREAVAKGIEFWNPSFEKIGFKNAIVAKQMSDTADWDPADTRYNVIRWMIVPGSAYAVGPSRANPYTGQIYDADVRFSSDWVRYMYNFVDRFVEPLSFSGSSPEDTDAIWEQNMSADDGRIDFIYQQEMAEEAAFGMAYVSTVYDDLAAKDSVMKVYVNTYLTEIIAHEVGHTLGFRHNFKASTIYALDQVNDLEWTKQHSTSGSIMDYLPPNVAGPDQPQGAFFAEVPGPFDDWMVEYAYSDFQATTPEEELPQLKQIAGKAALPELVYGTDEDAFGWSTRSIDPYCNMHDHGSDPLAYALHRVKLTRHLWANLVDKFEKPGDRYQNIYRGFVTGWRSYSEMALIASKYVGGVFRSNLHIGDTDAPPFEVMAASEQRRAVQTLREILFSADEFDLPEDLMNRLQPERFPDFNWSVGRTQIDYPIHERVLGIQMTAVNRLYSPAVISRLRNNIQRLGPDDDKYTMYDMFTEVRRAIWSEVVAPNNVNSFRRQLQLAHLGKIVNIYLSKPSQYPADARTLAANDLQVLKSAAQSAMSSGALDDMSKAHFSEVVRQIESAQSASRNYAGSR